MTCLRLLLCAQELASELSEREQLLHDAQVDASSTLAAAISPLRVALRGRLSRGTALQSSLEHLKDLRSDLEARAASVSQALDAAQLVPPFRHGVALSALEKQRDQLLRYAMPLRFLCDRFYFRKSSSLTEKFAARRADSRHRTRRRYSSRRANRRFSSGYR